jgi:predicted lipoprotein with Yx(FWY)xxD motif
MKRVYFVYAVIIGFLLVLLIAACGTTTGSGGGGAYGGGTNTGAVQTATAAANATATANAVATNNAYNGGGYGCSGRYCTTPTLSGGSSVVIKTASISVGGKSLTVLTNAQGLTLYYRTSDTPTSVCSGGCASAWPPIISSSVPAAPAGVHGKLALLSDANGSQVTYNGHPLYTYAGDTGPGQANGQGFGGVWFVVTTSLGA